MKQSGYSAWTPCHSKVNVTEKVTYPSPLSYILLLYVAECQQAHDAGLCGAGPHSHPACSDMWYTRGLISAVCSLFLGCWAVCYPFWDVFSQRYPQYPRWTLTCHESVLKSSGAGGSSDLCPQGLHYTPTMLPMQTKHSLCLPILQRWQEYFKRCQGHDSCIRGGKYSQRLISYTHLLWKRQKLCSSRDVLEEPLTPSSLAAQEVKAR